ncbi:MAG: CHAT domain-containing protein [Burkholderiales bacterium]|nr:CHAT domain-containing protein [Burkholderiales bacterium]
MSTDARRLAHELLLASERDFVELLTRPAGLAPADLAWALKHECYEAWNSEPQRASHCASLLGTLADLHPEGAIPALAAWTGGIAALAQGHMGDALAKLDAAFGQFMALQLEQHAAETRIPKIAALAMLGRETEAHVEAQSALRLFIAHGDERSAGKVELNLGAMLARQDRHEDAAALFRTAGIRFARANDTTQSIFADIGLANALTWTFQLQDARFVAERARVRAEARGYKVLAAHAHSAKGRIDLHRGQHAPALQSLAKASALFREAGATPQQLIEADTALAEAYAAVGLLPEALAAFRTVVTQAAAASAMVEMARALVGEATVLSQLGETADAVLKLTQARDLFASFDNQTSLAFVELCLGQNLLRDHRSAEARECAARAASQFERSLVATWQLECHLLEAAAATELGELAAARAAYGHVIDAVGPLSQIERRARVGLAAVELRDNNDAIAHGHLTSALRLIDEQRAALPDDEFRSAIGAEAEQACDLLVAAVLADPACQPEDVWSAVERGRARAMAHGLTLDSTRVPADLGLKAELGLVRERLAEALSADEAPLTAALTDRIRRLEGDLLEQHRRAVLLAPGEQPGDARGTNDASGLNQLQAALGHDGALVEYHLGERHAIACVITRQTSHWVVIDSEDVNQHIQGLRFQIEALKYGSRALRVHADQLMQRCALRLQALYRCLWRPVAALTRSCPRVVIVPHKVLHYVPFCALHDGDTNEWLVQRHEIVLAPSAAVWLQLQQRRPPRRQHLLALGNGSTHLAHVTVELDTIARSFGMNARQLRGNEATQTALRLAAPAADVLHIACHGSFRADNPAFSFLQLADGPFTVRDAAELKLHASLVVLSACETANSRISPGDELLGLVRGFTLAGASAVMASQWAVDDISTASLMRSMYARLVQGDGPARALQAAQCEMARNGSHPFYWAAFGVYGRA